MSSHVLTLSTGTYSRALILDDDEIMRKLMSHLVSQIGVPNIDTAADGEDGKRMFDKAKGLVDVVLCDLNMPGTDGFQFMEFLAERRFAGAVIVVSGTDDRTRHSAALMARFHGLRILGVLKKPFKKDELVAALGFQPQGQ